RNAEAVDVPGVEGEVAVDAIGEEPAERDLRERAARQAIAHESRVGIRDRLAAERGRHAQAHPTEGDRAGVTEAVAHVDRLGHERAPLRLEAAELIDARRPRRQTMDVAEDVGEVDRARRLGRESVALPAREAGVEGDPGRAAVRRAEAAA